MKHLTAQEGNEATTCYRSIIVLAPDNREAHAQLEQLANHYVNWAKTAINQANFQLAEEYLPLSQLQPDHPQLADLNQSSSRSENKYPTKGYRKSRRPVNKPLKTPINKRLKTLNDRQR